MNCASPKVSPRDNWILEAVMFPPFGGKLNFIAIFCTLGLIILEELRLESMLSFDWLKVGYLRVLSVKSLEFQNVRDTNNLGL